MVKGFNEIYPFATENVKGYFTKFDFLDKEVMTVGSSLDQALNAYLLGAKKVTVFDINPYTETFYKLKKHAILKLSRNELYQVLTSQELLKEFASSEQIPIGEIKISKDQLSKQAIFQNNVYLSSEKSYERLRQILNREQPQFITGDIFQIKEEDIPQKYDIVILSNILQYITTFYPTQEPFEVLKKAFPNWKQLLEDEGTLQLLYLYSYSIEQAKKNNHPIPIYNLKSVNDSIDETLSIDWFQGTLYTYNKYDQDAIVTYKKER